MLRRSRWIACLATVGLGIALLLSAGLLALRHVSEPFASSRALDISTATLRCDEALSQAAGLASSRRMNRNWSLDLPEDQINGWLTIDLPRNHGYLLPVGFSEPRVALRENCVLLAGRYQKWGLSTALLLELNVDLSEPNLLSVRFERAQAGALPLPMADALALVGSLADDLDLHVTWRQAEGDPVALLRLPPAAPGDDALMLEALLIEGGRLRASGGFQRGRDLPLAAEPATRR